MGASTSWCGGSARRGGGRERDGGDSREGGDGDDGDDGDVRRDLSQYESAATLEEGVRAAFCSFALPLDPRAALRFVGMVDGGRRGNSKNSLIKVKVASEFKRVSRCYGTVHL